jgi:hypothetical protein
MPAHFRKGQRVRITSTGEVGTVGATYTVMGDQTVEFDTPHGTSFDIYAVALERISEKDFRAACAENGTD